MMDSIIELLVLLLKAGKTLVDTDGVSLSYHRGVYSDSLGFVFRDPEFLKDYQIDLTLMMGVCS
jgi:hypothetical protein